MGKKKGDCPASTSDLIQDPKSVTEISPSPFECDEEALREKFQAPKSTEVHQEPTKMKMKCLSKDDFETLEPKQIMKEPGWSKATGLGKRHIELLKSWSPSVLVWGGVLCAAAGFLILNNKPVSGHRWGKDT